MASGWQINIRSEPYIHCSDKTGLIKLQKYPFLPLLLVLYKLKVSGVLICWYYRMIALKASCPGILLTGYTCL